MKTRISARHVLPATLLVLGLAACGRTQPAPAPAGQGTQEVHEMQGAAGMPMDSAVMRRHMQEADSMMARVRGDVEQMRRLSPEQWSAHLPGHLAVMDSMFAMMQRHMGEGGGAMQQHQQMGEGMGMHGEMHQGMMGEMQALRADVEALRNATPAEVRQRMSAHLERLERMLQMMEQMHRMQQQMHTHHQGM